MPAHFLNPVLIRAQPTVSPERSHAFEAIIPDLKSLLQPSNGDLFERTEGVSTRRATTLFSTGFLLSLAGGFVFKSFRKATNQVTATPEILGDVPKTKDRQVGFLNRDIYGMYQQKFLAFFKLILEQPNHRNAFFSYLGVSLLGYFSANLLQGLQEAWVRLEETRIRARLLDRLTGVVQQSIRTKQELDNQLRKEAGQKIQAILERNGVPPCPFLIPPNPAPESLLINNQYFAQPTHRTLHFGQQTRLPKAPDGNTFWRPWELGVFAGGLALGLLVHGFLKLISKVPKTDGKVIQTVTENLTLVDQEAGFIRKNKWILVGMYGLMALIRVGKLWFDGLREIEVTRLNAGTEYRYQYNNWLTLDPRFHQIAEVEALDNDLHQLEQDLRYLRWDRPLLEQRIQTILLNIGLRSAPKYFPMIPMVGLREARS